MTIRSYATSKRTIRRSRRAARFTAHSIVAPVAGSNVNLFATTAQ